MRFLVQSESVELHVLLYRSGDQVDPIASSSDSYGDSSGILLSLQEGDYILVIERGASYHRTFCQTFSIVMGISPVSALQISCPAEVRRLLNCANVNNPQNISPDFSSLQESIGSSPFIYSMEPKPDFPYAYYYQGLSQQQIFAIHFDVVEVSQLYVEIGVNIAAGDVSIYLSENDGNTQLIEGVHTGSAVFLFAQLEPNTYAINFATGATQTENIDDTQFPDCLIYTMRFTILPVDLVKGCLRYIMLPDTLLSPSFLYSSKFVSIHNEFQQPDSTHAMELTVH